MPKTSFYSLILVLALGASCQQWTQNLQVISVVTHTPSREESVGYNPELAQIFPPKFFKNDFATIFVGLLEIDGYTPNDPAIPAGGAAVTLATTNDSIELCETSTDFSGEFKYPVSDETTSQDQSEQTALAPSEQTPCPTSSWAYEYDTEHTLSILWNEIDYKLYFKTRGPQTARPFQITPTPQDHTSLIPTGLKHHSLNSDLQLSWSEPIAATNTIPAITISRLLYTGNTASSAGFLNPSNWSESPSNPVYQSPLPKTEELLDFILKSPTQSINIKGSNFSQTGLYLISVYELTWSNNATANISLGSAALSGYGTNLLLWVD